MFIRIKRLFHLQTSKNIIINSLGNYLNVFFISLFALLLVRIMGPVQYGVLSVLLGIAYVLANILDLGTTATIYSRVPVLQEKNRQKLYHFLKSTFLYQAIFSITIIILLIFTFPFLDEVFFKTQAPSWELNLTAISVLFFIWQNFILNILSAAKKFFEANLYLNLANLGKTALLGFLILINKVTVGTVIFTFGIVGPLIFFFLTIIKRRQTLVNFLQARFQRKEVHMRYTLIYFIASQFFNLASRIDLFLLSYFGFKSEVGYYGLSQKIILTVLASVVSITQVLSPSFSKVKTKKEIKSLVKRGAVYLLIPTGLFLALVFIPNGLFNLVFTLKFAQTAVITKKLSLSYILYPLANLPLLYLLYSLRKPVYILITNLLLFFIITLGSYILIPRYGVFGPPYAIFTAFALATGFLIIVSLIEYKKSTGEN